MGVGCKVEGMVVKLISLISLWLGREMSGAPWGGVACRRKSASSLPCIGHLGGNGINPINTHCSNL